MIRAAILGCGGYLPAQVLSNEALIAAKGLDSSDEWIARRTGIRQRAFAAENEQTADLATEAARAALKDSGVEVAALDLIILATTTPDHAFPATATKVQANLGMSRGFAFDIQAACSGFIYALALADHFIRLGQARHALVIGAEKFSRLLDWSDRSTCVLFGDGAGAVVLGAVEGTGNKRDRGILSTHLHSDGSHYGQLQASDARHAQMNGAEVFRHAVTNLASVVDEALDANGLTPAEIDWLVPHQANQRIIDGTGKKLHLPPERVVSTVAIHANTSAASIPLALATAVQDGRIKKGDLLLLDAMGAGFTWGAAVVRW